MGCTGGESFLPSLGGWDMKNGGHNVDIREDSGGEREDKNDNCQSKVH